MRQGLGRQQTIGGLVAAMLLVFTTACGETTEPGTSPDSTTDSSADSEPTTAASAAETPEPFPTSTVSLVIPSGPGGGWDGVAQLIHEPWGDLLGQSIRIQHLADAGGYVARADVASAPDGYTMMLNSSESTAVQYAVNDAEYNLSEDLYCVGNVNTDAVTVFVANDSPLQDMSDLVEAAEAGNFNLGVTQANSINHLGGLVLQQEGELGDNLNIVPLPSGAELRTAVAGGHVDAGISPSQGIIAFADIIRPLGYFAETNPAPDLIDALGVNEQGLGFEVPDLLFSTAVTVGIGAQQDHPDQVQVLVDTLRETLEDPEVTEALDTAGYGLYTDYWSPDECNSYFADLATLVDEYAPLFDDSE